MKKECGGFDEQTFVVLQITFIRPSGTRHNFLRRALTTMRRLSSPVVIEDNNCMRAHRIRSETRSIFDLKSGVQSVSSGSRMRRALESRYYEMQLLWQLHVTDRASTVSEGKTYSYLGWIYLGVDNLIYKTKLG